MTYDKAKDRKSAKDRAKHDLVVAQELAKLAKKHVPFSVAALIAGTTPGNIAQVVATNVVADGGGPAH